MMYAAVIRITMVSSSVFYITLKQLLLPSFNYESSSRLKNHLENHLEDFLSMYSPTTPYFVISKYRVCDGSDATHLV